MFENLLTLIKPEMAVTLLAAVAAFATVLTILIPMLSRDKLSSRMQMMAVERDQLRAVRLAEIQKRDTQTRLRAQPKGFMQEIVEKLKLRSMFDTEEVRDKLKMAGMRGQAPLVTYMFFRVAVPVIIFVVAMSYLFVIGDFEYPPLVNLGLGVGAAYIGYYVPNMFITNLIQRRQTAIKEAFPDALDMLLICVQSGMSPEVAFGKVATEVGEQSTELAEEFSLTTAELSYLQDRRLAYENLGKRTGIPGVKAVAMALIQAERYGTPIGQALRVMSRENRDMRMAEAERKAAALPPKLTVPMIIFFLPVLFVVILGPAIIQVYGWT